MQLKVEPLRGKLTEDTLPSQYLYGEATNLHLIHSRKSYKSFTGSKK